MVSSISQGIGSGLFFDALRSMQKEQAEALEQSLAEDLAAETLVAPSPQSVSVHAASSNLMSRNFASAERSESKYVNATLNSFSVDKQLQNQSTNRVTALLKALGGVQGPTLYGGTGSKGGVPEATIQMAMKRIRDTEEHEASERNLDEIKEGIEQRKLKAMAPKDENGNPIETGLPTGGTGEAAPMPEISGSNPAPAPAPEVSAAPTPDIAGGATSTPEVSTPSAPSTVSIDITV